MISVGDSWFTHPAAILVAIGALALGASTEARPESADLLNLFSRSQGEARLTVDHRAWDDLLARYVRPGPGGLNRVDYAAFKAGGQGELKRYVAALEQVDPRALGRSEGFAYLANLYNAKTIDIVLDHYPVKSIKDISLGGGIVAALTGGPWKAKVVRIGGIDASLDDIEHGVLRPLYNDPRVHYAVNCASIGCPNLGTAAFTGAKLEEQLDAAARAFINSPRGVKVVDGDLIVSSIYDWFEPDFGGSLDGVREHLKAFATPELATGISRTTGIADYAYDWSLNDIAR
jgi:hypothetical protein